MAKKKAQETLAAQATEPTGEMVAAKERKPRDVQYGTRLVITFRAHKTVKTLPNVIPAIEAWAKNANLMVEHETVTTTQKIGKKTEKGSPLPYPKTEVIFDTEETYAMRHAAASGMDRDTTGALRGLILDPEVQAKAKELGITTAELVRRAEASLKKSLLG